jgi:micrococcal nuclease
MPTRRRPAPLRLVPLLACAALLPACVGAAEGTPVQVLEVHDGDTIRVALPGGKHETVRIIGVDAPEIEGPYREEEFGGQAATAFAKRLIGLGPVALERDATDDDRDKYGRLLRYVRLPDGRDAGAEIIAAGYARAYRRFHYARRESYLALERQARDAHRGLWGGGAASRP